MLNDPLIIAGKSFTSRLLMGSALFPNQRMMLDALTASECEMVTIAIRRINLNSPQHAVSELLRQPHYHLLPNTAGCFTATEAVLTAELAREALQTDWVKLEVIGDRDTLYPDSVELLNAAAQLVAKGFIVMAYAPDDVVVCQRLADLGCAAVMPLASPIGSGQGIANPYNLALIRSKLAVPVIVDAGIGTASDAALAMELGADAVLLNSAVARADDPVAMARAMNYAVQAGRLAYNAGRIPKKFYAESASPLAGKINPPHPE